MDASYSFPRPSNPWSPTFPELLNFNDLTGTVFADFIGIKIGDLSGDAKGASQGTGTVRSGRVVSLEVRDREMRAGEQVVLPIQLSGDETLDGIQFTFSFDPKALRLLVAECDFASPESIGLVDPNGWITMALPDTIVPGTSLMNLAFEVLRSGRTSDYMSINSRITNAEGYIGAETRGLQLEFRSFNQEEERPRAMQNYPNPFSGHTAIPFWLPEEDTVWLKVFDLNGRLVLERSMRCARGQHSFDILSNTLKDGQVWMYQIGGKDWVETKLMQKY